MLIYFFLIIPINSLAIPTTPFTPNYRILGGKKAEIGEFPYQVSLRRSKNKRHFCGGSILNESFILTAAHCLYSGKRKLIEEEIFIVAGQIQRTLKPNSTIRQVQNLIRHPRYNSYKYEHDIALIELKEELPFTTTKLIKPILLNEEEVLGGLKCTVTGWGAIKFDNKKKKAILHAEILRKANFKTYSIETCRKIYKNKGNRFKKDDVICAMGIRTEMGPVDSCKCDSGGPLVCKQRLTGIVSHGVGCGHPKYPGFYTDVMRHLDWIRYNSSPKRFCNNFLIFSLTPIVIKLWNYYYNVFWIIYCLKHEFFLISN